ncbi:hypothetical protein CRUP_034861 [Coryphaenoides rupestris]|nr:hypothetical protein CRUP_034861 [Coryphaenoides rupestris]
MSWKISTARVVQLKWVCSRPANSPSLVVEGPMRMIVRYSFRWSKPYARPPAVISGSFQWDANLATDASGYTQPGPTKTSGRVYSLASTATTCAWVSIQEPTAGSSVLKLRMFMERPTRSPYFGRRSSRAMRMAGNTRARAHGMSWKISTARVVQLKWVCSRPANSPSLVVEGPMRMIVRYSFRWSKPYARPPAVISGSFQWDANLATDASGYTQPGPTKTSGRVYSLASTATTCAWVSIQEPTAGSSVLKLRMFMERPTRSPYFGRRSSRAMRMAGNTRARAHGQPSSCGT